MSKEEIELVVKYWVKVLNDINNLQQRIDEAIDFIEKNSGMISKFTMTKYTYVQEEMSTDSIDELLEILKGDSND